MTDIIKGQNPNSGNFAIEENPRDISEQNIRELWRLVGWNWYEDNDGYARTAAAMNDPRSTTYAIRDGNRLVGILNALSNGFSAYLAYLVVAPDWQGRGLGRALLAKYDETFADCQREFMAAKTAVGFYEHAGYDDVSDEWIAMGKWL